MRRPRPRAPAGRRQVGRDEVVLDVASRSREPAPAPRLVLVQALAKGDRGELAVELATEVGVDAWCPGPPRAASPVGGRRGEQARARWRVDRPGGGQAVAARVAARGRAAASTTAPGPAGSGRHRPGAARGRRRPPLTRCRCRRAATSCSSSGPRAGSPTDELAALGGTAVRLGPDGPAHVDGGGGRARRPQRAHGAVVALPSAGGPAGGGSGAAGRGGRRPAPTTTTPVTTSAPRPS